MKPVSLGMIVGRISTILRHADASQADLEAFPVTAVIDGQAIELTVNNFQIDDIGNFHISTNSEKETSSGD
jgi:hypothetical protein